MRDFKEQLESIRPSIKKSDKTLSLKRDHVGAKKPKSESKSSYVSCSQESVFLSRLSLIGQVKNYVQGGCYGFISAQPHDLYFHISGRIEGVSKEISDTVKGKYIIYVLGDKSAKDGRPFAFQWCFADEVTWPSYAKPKTQSEVDQIRWDWLTHQSIEVLLDILKADWYEKFERNQVAKSVLKDSVLEELIIEKLKSLPADEWRKLNIRNHIEEARYVFTSQWCHHDDNELPKSLINNFSALQLAELTTPRYRWALKVDQKNQGKLFEWALRSVTDEKQRILWERNLEDDFEWDSKVATSLIESTDKISNSIFDWIKRLTKSERISSKAIERRINEHPEESSRWFDLLPDTSKVKILATKNASLNTLLEFLESKNDQTLYQVALFNRSLAIDLESDGESIWEIGTAKSLGKKTLLSRNDIAGKLDESLKELEQEIVNSALIVGHNITFWDWPILESLIINKAEPIIWDTLLIQFMLEPWKASQALGGSHFADNDATKSLELFRKQISRLGGTIAYKVLKGEFTCTLELMLAVGEAVQSLEWALPSATPDFFKSIPWLSDDKIAVCPPDWIRHFDWIKDVVIVSANPEVSLETTDLILHKDRLCVEHSVQKSSIGIAIQSVVNIANFHSVSVRLGMLPLWVTENDNIKTALYSTIEAPDYTTYKFKIARYPIDKDWYASFDKENFVFIDPPKNSFLAGDTWLRASKLPSLIRDKFTKGEAPRSGDLYHGTNPDELTNSVWITLDPAAKKLSMSGNCWREFSTIYFNDLFKVLIHRTAEKPWKKPRIINRKNTLLFPGAEDQAGYWKDVLSGVLSVSKSQTLGTVTILLVSISKSQELLELLNEYLAEINHAEAKIQYHSRRERLVRSAKNAHSCIIDCVDNWHLWRSLGELTNIPIQPVIEAFPIYEWYSSWSKELDKQDYVVEELVDFDDYEVEFDELTNDADEPDSYNIDDERVHLVERISLSKIIEILPQLISENIGRWLWQIDIADYVINTIVLDARIKYNSRSLSQQLDFIDLPNFNFTDEQLKCFDRVFEPLKIIRELPPSDYESLRSFLEKHWNKGKIKGEPGWIHEFRDATQKPAIEVIRERSSDVLVTLPTGEGKSVLFQVPALCRGLRTRRLTIVISPLRALMRDQVARLWDQGFHQSVDYLSADRLTSEIEDVFQGILDNRIVLLYVAPERFRNRRFIDLLNRRFDNDGAFEYIVIDETHCVSQWGYDFRPDYFYALNLICSNYRKFDHGEKSPFILLSATVTAANRDHLASILKGSDNRIVKEYLPFIAKPEQYFHPIRSHIFIRPQPVLGLINMQPKTDWPIQIRLDHILRVINEANANQKSTNQHSAVIVFVARRDHAEQLAFKIDKACSTRVDYFHAGLDTVSREEIYQRFKEGDIDVLVATKAFGMGMDIPHIHWVVHLAPPTFLEDYLQEVGRIGRGEKERKLANLTELEALLLYSDDDFQANRSHIQRSQVDIRQISDLYKKILAESKEVNGVFIATMPDAGYEKYNTSAKRRFACNQVRKILYWLECLNRVEIVTMMPGLLPVKLATTRLKEIADHDSSHLGEVASLLCSLVSINLTIISPPTYYSTNTQINSPGIVDIIIDSLSNFVGFLFGSRKPQEPKPEPKKLLYETVTPQANELDYKLPENEDAILNLGHILRATSLTHVDDVLSTLTELEKRNAIEINRKISFSQGRNSKAKAYDIDLLFKGIHQASELILDRLKKNSSEYIIDFDDLISGLNLENASQLLFDSRSLGRTVCYVLRSSGVRIREKIVADNNREISASLSVSKYRHVKQQVNMTLSTSQELWKVFSSRVTQGGNELEIKSLLEVTKTFSKNNCYRERDLRRHLNLLGSMKLVSVSEPIIPLSYVLSISPKEIPLDDNDHTEIWSQLRNVNRLAELRADALEIFLHIPDEGRDRFIEGYFNQSTPEGLETFLNEQLLFVEDVIDGKKSFVKQKSEHLRAEAIKEFFSIYQTNPEEPNQWRAITHPFNRNLLVNAGPGSGKTSVLIARIAHLIRNQHIKPEEILVLAFNRAVVFEIRSRINDLFRQIGYGAYVRRLKVFTFHTFAAIHYRSRSNLSDDWKKDRELLLQNFANKLEVDSDFRNNVAGNFRSILVDEFQDANDDIFRIVKSISSASTEVGVMAIGDDDQDILAWNRVNHGSSETYFNRFISDFSLNQDDQLTLSVNFRSGDRIVEETQSFLNDFFRDKSDGVGRLKSIKLRSASEAHDSEVYKITEDRNDLTSVIDEIMNSSIFQSANEGKDSSLAILCRTNHEVAQVFHSLRYQHPDLIIQNNTSYPLSRLRHIGVWNDILKRDLSLNGDYPLSEGSYEKLCVEYNKFNIPEITKSRSEDISLKRLFELCFQENSYPFLSHLIDLINTLDTDDLIRMEGYKHENLSKIVVSTIHKVKGLEFDEVLIAPSYANFPLDRHNYIKAMLSSNGAFQSAAEEARLLYVAMTRAKRKLTYWIGDREQSWLTLSVHQGRSESGKLLHGKPDEVGISWAWETTNWNENATATCRYIEENVRVGDKLKLGGRGNGTGRSIFHCDSSGIEHQISFTSKVVGAGGRNSDLTVSAVLRCPYNGTPYFGGITNSEVVRRGWGHVVMASGILR